MHRDSKCFTLQYPGRTNVLIDDDIKLSEAYNPQSGLPEPRLHTFTGIWDTGATNSVISRRVVEALGIQPIRQTEVSTANGKATANLYLANIYLRNMVMFTGQHVTEGDLGDKIDVLIGMDIIGNGDFAVTCSDAATCFSFRCPSQARVDYVEEYNRKFKPAPTEDEKRRARNKRKAQKNSR